ncbi:ABC transporter substrate-binding protein [Pseudofulvimonas gallinarii]|uniref:Iron complex transport system substrate-binding protein n=1 Tax=Pseudofulvimonas gallinarii TaxID=634155 RepID=A0A4S3KZV4_9GAMM|nr:ABC transporter substrate-binding protein [Pseudofulvimonas gallinarii]TCS99298.1 iron complex transport system substrate-binding protein [Pseudofulvimonas gallinarii]THD13904.1 iron ABC transporter substrate-binding protein [Pseudofulvimonas gallinarii]
MNRRSFLSLLALATLCSRSSRSLAREGGVAARFGELPPAGRVSRVFAAGSPAAVLACVLAPGKLLGWPMRMDAAARALLPAPAADLPFLGRLSGRGSTVGTETLLSLRPDLVLDAGSVNPLHLSGAERVWQQTGLPYVLVDGRLEDHPAQLREVGRLIGAAGRGRELAGLAAHILDRVRAEASANRDEAPPRVYYARGRDGLETGLAGSINMEAIEFAGASNVAAEAGSGGLTQVSMEQILAWNPDVLLTQDAGFARRVRGDRLWRSVRAVRNGRIHVAPILPFGWLDGPPGVNRLVGLPWLLPRLYPHRYPGSDRGRLDRFTAETFERFYGKALPAALVAAAADGEAG